MIGDFVKIGNDPVGEMLPDPVPTVPVPLPPAPGGKIPDAMLVADGNFLVPG
jgi:hypothetical protein